MSGENIENGDKVSWNWNGSTPSGKVAEVKAGEVSVTSKRGNEIKKSGDEENPAVHIERSGNDVVKTAKELNIESKGKGAGTDKEAEPAEKKAGGQVAKKTESEKKDPHAQNGATKSRSVETEGDANTGDKRKTNQKVDDDDDHAAEGKQPDNKKQKTNGKKAGRPKGSGAKKEKKTPVTGKSERKTRSQGAA